MRLPVIALLLVLLASALPAQGAGPSFAAPVRPGDGDLGTALISFLAPVGFVDANGNGAVDAVQPDEALYLDLDASRTVSFGDLRLTGFLTYAAGSSVDQSNRDFGRFLATPTGWFAHDGPQRWYFDSDASKTVSLADVRITGDAQGSKVRVGDPDAGAALTQVQAIANPPKLRVGWADADRDNVRQLTEAVYLDVNLNSEVDAGEVRFTTTGLGLDNEPTRGEFDAAVAGLQQEDARIRAEQQAGDARLAQGIAALGGQLGAMGDRLASMGSWLLVLAAFTVIGLACVAWYARHLHRISEPEGEPAPEPASLDQAGFR